MWLTSPCQATSEHNWAVGLTYTYGTLVKTFSCKQQVTLGKGKDLFFVFVCFPFPSLDLGLPRAGGQPRGTDLLVCVSTCTHVHVYTHSHTCTLTLCLTCHRWKAFLLLFLLAIHSLPQRLPIPQGNVTDLPGLWVQCFACTAESFPRIYKWQGEIWIYFFPWGSWEYRWVQRRQGAGVAGQGGSCDHRGSLNRLSGSPTGEWWLSYILCSARSLMDSQRVMQNNITGVSNHHLEPGFLVWGWKVSE